MTPGVAWHFVPDSGQRTNVGQRRSQAATVQSMTYLALRFLSSLALGEWCPRPGLWRILVSDNLYPCFRNGHCIGPSMPGLWRPTGQRWMDREPIPPNPSGQQILLRQLLSHGNPVSCSSIRYPSSLQQALNRECLRRLAGARCRDTVTATQPPRECQWQALRPVSCLAG